MIEGVKIGGGAQVASGEPGRWLAILRTCLIQRPDVIHLDWIQSYYFAQRSWQTYIRSFVFILEIFLLRMTSVKLIWTIHNLYPHNALPSRVQRLVRSYFAKECTLVRVFSETTKEDVCHNFNVEPAKVFVVPEGSYIDHYPNTYSNNEAKSSLGLSHFSRVLLFIGGISEYKGVPDLIDAFNAIENETKAGSLLLIAGKVKGGNLLQEINHAIKGKVDVKLVDEFVSDEDIDLFLNASDLVVLPFKAITNSGSVILAMGYGKPIVTLAGSAVVARLSHQKNLLFKRSESLKSKLEEVINMSSEELMAIGKNNASAASKLRWEDFGELLKRECF